MGDQLHRRLCKVDQDGIERIHAGTAHQAYIVFSHLGATRAAELAAGGHLNALEQVQLGQKLL